MDDVHLRHKDYRALYWLLGECCELGRTPEAWLLRLFEFFQEHLGVHMMVSLEGNADMTHGRASPDHKTPICVYGKSPQFVLGLMRAYWENGGINDDPALPMWRRIRTAVATKARPELACNRDWERSAIVNEYYYQTESDEMILSTCPVGNEKHLLMNLWRPRGGKPYSKRETEMVSLITQELSPLLAARRLTPLSAGHAQLTPRLKQILSLLRQGHTEKQIANRLGTSAHTVHNQVRTLYRALGVTSRGELFALDLLTTLEAEE